jgi:copper resistance protein B
MTPFRTVPRLRVLVLAIALPVGAVPAFAQEMDHSQMQMPPATAAPPAKKPTTKKPATRKPVAKPAATKTKAADPHAGHVMPSPAAPEPSPQPAAVDHAAMGHASPPPTDTAEPDHAAMGHKPAAATEAPDVDHAAMGHDMPPREQPTGMDHSAMGHGAHAGSGDLPATAAPREPIPEITEADREAAFPDVAGHAVHDNAVHRFALLDRLETWNEDDASPIAWEGSGWIGTDLNRAWIRSEGEALDGRVESANVELFYGRAIARWWDAVVGVRHDFGDGPSRTFAAVGVMGLAPYMFEVEATAYLGESGQTGLGLEAEYETLFTNRLILQSVIEAEAWGKDDPARGIGSGLAKVEAGFRLRYEFTRKFAPYVGIVRERVFGQTADFREAKGVEVDDTRFVIGLRTWF